MDDRETEFLGVPSSWIVSNQKPHFSKSHSFMQTARLFPNGQSQAVRLPKEYRFEGEWVYIRRAGNAVVLLPRHVPWETLFASLDLFSDDFGGAVTAAPLE